ncbi:MAG: response regulator transcription factor [Desulfuromonadales bacterium]|nr:response regulator transcription factor [Desulfuromonadales bacterium]
MNPTPPSRILIIEDEADLAELIAFHLRQEGYQVEIAGNGRLGLERALAEPPDLVVLDLMLPEMLGSEVCRNLRKDKRTAALPVLMLTAKGEEIDRVVGFEVGADDYVVKPFSLRELLLRIKSLLRRSQPVTDNGGGLQFGPLSIDTQRHEVRVDNEVVVLTAIEYRLLTTLAERRGRLQSRDQLLTDVWGYNYVGDTRTVDTHVTRLRSKLGAGGELIRTVRGFGYKLEI